MRKEFTLSEWKSEQEEKIRAFELYWKHASASNPRDFPTTMEMSEWDEQFEFFCDEV